MNSFHLRNRMLLLLLSVVVFSHFSYSQTGIFEGSGDIGPCKLSGSASFDPATDTYTLTGSGTNMWGTGDEFFMIWKKITGEFSLSAAIAFEGGGVDPHRKVGLIIRESLDSDAMYADITVHGDGLTSLQFRNKPGAETEEKVSGITYADHLELIRKGNTIIVKTGKNVFSAHPDQEITMDLPATCYVGLFICSHNPDVIEKGYFSKVSLKMPN